MFRMRQNTMRVGKTLLNNIDNIMAIQTVQTIRTMSSSSYNNRVAEYTQSKICTMTNTDTDTDMDTDKNTERYIKFFPKEISDIFFDHCILNVSETAIKKGKIFAEHAEKDSFIIKKQNNGELKKNYAKNNSIKITRENGDQYFLPVDVFHEIYTPIMDVDDLSINHSKSDFKDNFKANFMAKPNKVISLEVFYNIKFLAPWGEYQYLNQGDFLVKRQISKDNTEIYGVKKDEFHKSYEIIKD